MIYRALDLFCCGGGASAGLHQAGMYIVQGIDINEQPEYPFNFKQGDVLKLLPNMDLTGIDFIWASPPCQAYSFAAGKSRNLGNEYPDLVEPTRELLLKIGKPFVMENVPTAPLRKDLLLCGEMFGLKVIRHRIFEVHGFEIEQPEHIKHRGTVKDGYYVTVAGHGGDGKASLKAWQDATEIDWIKDKHTLAQVVPPAYSRYIAQSFINYMTKAA